MPRKGLQFEKLITKLESLDLPKNAKVISPDFIIDKETGLKREVDISIRYQIGSIKLLIIIECRDRKSKQGSPWIEEAYSKKKSVNADKIVLVSSSGFSVPAQTKARINGIELRSFDELDDQTILSWISVKKITIVYKKYEPSKLSIDIYENQKIESSVVKELEFLKNIDFNTKSFQIKSTREKVDLNYIFWDSLGNKADDFFNNIPIGVDKKINQPFNFNYTNRESIFQIPTSKKPIDIKSINIQALCWREEREFPLIRHFNYADNKGRIILEGAEFEFELSGKNKKVLFTSKNIPESLLREITMQVTD